MQNIELNIGDKIGFVNLAGNIDATDNVNFFPVVEVTTRDGERAYKYEFPNGEVSRAAIRQSDLAYHSVELQQPTDPKMICLNSRKEEFKSALKRGLENDLQVYPDFEKDAFVVVNRTNNTEYKVRFETCAGAKLFTVCSCKDFEYRKHLCKHIAEVLQDAFFGVVESFGVVLQG